MAENIAHLAVFESATDGATYTEIDGLDSFSRQSMRDVLNVTSFADPSAHQIKIMGLKDGSIDLSGNVVFDVSTLTLNVGIKNIAQRARDGGALSLRAKVDGSGGTYKGVETLVKEFGFSAEVSGAVEWSASLQMNGAAWA